MVADDGAVRDFGRRVVIDVHGAAAAGGHVAREDGVLHDLITAAGHVDRTAVSAAVGAEGAGADDRVGAVHIHRTAIAVGFVALKERVDERRAGPGVMDGAAGAARVLNERAGLEAPDRGVAEDGTTIAAVVVDEVAVAHGDVVTGHKLDAAASVVAAVGQMRRNVSSHDDSAVTDRFLVERMAPKPIAELIVGIRRDPQFGHALTLGSGGTLVELVGDSKTLLLPCSAGEIEAALQALRIGALMRGFRGNAAANVPALAKTLEQLCTAVLNAADEIHDIEINPLFVGTDDAVAVDVLMHKASK